jgi:putative two-component system response regulator
MPDDPQSISSPPADATRRAKIAIVDDEPINVMIVRKHLQGVGYENFITTSDATTATELLVRQRPDVVLLDVMMPQVDGIQILRAIRNEPSLAHIPVLILTASTDSATKLAALEAGATDFLAKPVDASDLIPRVRNALVVKAHHDHLANYSQHLEQEVRLRTAELELSRLQVVHCLARAGEYRDDNTGRHVIRVARYSTILARELGFSETEATMLGTAALLHDVGKIGLPDSILLKPGPLDPAERQNMQRHCDIGHHIVEPMKDDDWLALQNCHELGMPHHDGSQQPLLELAVTIALTHHERWDGSGYPRRLAGEQIPIEGRIVAVADVFDALSSPRPYKAAMPIDRSLQIMEQDRGRHFDPAVFDALLRRMEDILRIYNQHADVRLAA